MLKEEAVINDVVMCPIFLDAVMAYVVSHKFRCSLAGLPAVFALGLRNEWPDVRRVAWVSGASGCVS